MTLAVLQSTVPGAVSPSTSLNTSPHLMSPAALFCTRTKLVAQVVGWKTSRECSPSVSKRVATGCNDISTRRKESGKTRSKLLGKNQFCYTLYTDDVVCDDTNVSLSYVNGC